MIVFFHHLYLKIIQINHEDLYYRFYLFFSILHRLQLVLELDDLIELLEFVYVLEESNHKQLLLFVQIWDRHRFRQGRKKFSGFFDVFRNRFDGKFFHEFFVKCFSMKKIL